MRGPLASTQFSLAAGVTAARAYDGVSVSIQILHCIFSQVKAVAEVMEAYESIAGRSLPDTPLIHFCRLLLQVRTPAHLFSSLVLMWSQIRVFSGCDVNVLTVPSARQALQKAASPKLLQLLRREYEPALQRDASFAAMLDRVEEAWYGVQQAGGLGGMLGDIMQMLTAPA